MIGVACKDASGAVELFHQHSARQQVGPSRRSKGEQEVSLRALLARMAISRPQHKARFANTTIAPFLKLVREVFRCHRFALLIQQHSLAGGQEIRGLAPGLRQFSEFARPSQPLFIARNQLCLRRAGDLSAGDDVEENGVALCARGKRG